LSWHFKARLFGQRRLNSRADCNTLLFMLNDAFLWLLSRLSKVVWHSFLKRLLNDWRFPTAYWCDRMSWLHNSSRSHLGRFSWLLSNCLLFNFPVAFHWLLVYRLAFQLLNLNPYD
jgi:hypothetical protein